MKLGSKLVTMLAMMTLVTPAFASLSQAQQDFLKRFDITEYDVVVDNPQYKIVTSKYVGAITFLGDTATFVQGSPAMYDAQQNQNFDVLGQAFMQEIPKDEDKFIIKKAKDEKYKAYVFFSPTCPHCRKVIADAANDLYAKQGITLVFIPLVNSHNPGEDLKMSYALSQPADKRFEAIVPTLDEMKVASKTVESLDEATHYAHKYAIAEYPVFFAKNGLKVLGYQDAETLSRLLAQVK